MNTPSIVIDGVTITDNEITANRSNDDLEFTASGSGKVVINGIEIPAADGSASQLLRTDASGVLSYFTSSILFDHTNIQDGTATVLGASSAVQAIDSFAKADVRSMKYTLQISDSTANRFSIVEANVTHDGTNAYVSTFGGADNGNSDGSSAYDTLNISADISGSNVRLLGQVNNTNNQVVKFVRRVINA